MFQVSFFVGLAHESTGPSLEKLATIFRLGGKSRLHEDEKDGFGYCAGSEPQL